MFLIGFLIRSINTIKIEINEKITEIDKRKDGVKSSKFQCEILKKAPMILNANPDIEINSNIGFGINKG